MKFTIRHLAALLLLSASTSQAARHEVFGGTTFSLGVSKGNATEIATADSNKSNTLTLNLSGGYNFAIIEALQLSSDFGFTYQKVGPVNEKNFELGFGPQYNFGEFKQAFYTSLKAAYRHHDTRMDYDFGARLTVGKRFPLTDHFSLNPEIYYVYWWNTKSVQFWDMGVKLINLSVQFD